MIQVFINNVQWLECEEHSLFHLAILDIIKKERAKESKRLLDLLTNAKNVKYSKPIGKDILIASRIIQ